VQREARHRRRALYSRRLIKSRDSLHETVAAHGFITRACDLFTRYKERATKSARTNAPLRAISIGRTGDVKKKT
jgi:hypothetical protein